MGRTSRTRKTSPAQDPVGRALDRLQKRMVDFAAKLCSIATVNPPGDRYLECCRFLAGKLRDLGLRTRIVRVPRAVQARALPGSADYPRASVVGRWDVGAAKTLHITGHYDVVPATSGWKTDPFKPVVRHRRLIARGSVDMKTSLAAAVFAVEAMQAARVRPAWNIELSFTPDEETGGELGLGYLVKAGKIKPDAAVLCEGAGGPDLGYAHKGVLWLDVTVLGKPGHACRPAAGVNALEMACGLIDELGALKAQYAKRRTGFRMNVASLKHPTMMIGGIAAGGGKVNTIPDRFHFTIDRRINPEENVADVKAEIIAAIRKAQRRHRKLRTQVRTLLHVPPGWTDPDDPFCRLARRAHAAVTGHRPRLRMTPGFTDMHWLTRDAGAPAVMYGTSGQGAHGDFEYTDLASIAQAARVYAEIALRSPDD